jgi:hypothetical protein
MLMLGFFSVMLRHICPHNTLSAEHGPYCAVDLSDQMAYYLDIHETRYLQFADDCKHTAIILWHAAAVH